MDYEDPPTGTLAKIKGRNAVYLYYASYGGGGGPLWAIEGVEVQLTTHDDWTYIQGVCEKVSPESILFHSDGNKYEIPISKIGRYDQFHLRSDMRFVFSDDDIEII